MSEQQTTTAAAKPSKTKVHSPAKLQAALGLDAAAWTKARYCGLVPGPDRDAGTYSGPLVDDLVARAEQIRADIPADLLTEVELRAELAVGYAEWRRAQEAGLLPDHDLFYSREDVADLLADPAAWRARIPAQPLGAPRCAELLTELTGLAVRAQDVEALAQAGHTAVVGEYAGRDLYDVDRLTALPENPEALAVLRGLVDQHAAWIEASLSVEEAAKTLHWPIRDFKRITAERHLTTGPDRRYARTDIAALADDVELCEEVRRSQLIGPDKAALHMELRRSDFNYVLAAGWVEPREYIEVQVGRRKTVDVPLFRVGDLENALTIPGVDWEAVRSVRAGETSPLREHVRLAASRADRIHAFCRQLSAELAVEVWPHWVNATDTWEIDWEQDEDARPSKEDVRARLREHPGAGRYSREITLSTRVGEVVRWARRMLEPGNAVVLDTETTSLWSPIVVEVAVVDASTGRTLLNTLVNPAGVEVSPGARAIHRITDEELATAPSWSQVWPKLSRAVRGKTVLAYNAPFDQGAIRRTHEHAGLDPAQLPAEWECLMQARSIRERVGHRIALGGSHRALGDARDARTVLQAVATAKTPARINQRTHPAAAGQTIGDTQ